MNRATGAAIGVILSLAHPAAQASPPPATDTPSAPDKALTPEESALVGNYDGRQTELAARLLLLEDRQFGFWLSYGALDEVARGHWSLKDGQVVLTVARYQTNDPDNMAQAFGPSVLQVEDGALTLPRYGRILKFRRDQEQAPPD